MYAGAFVCAVRKYSIALLELQWDRGALHISHPDKGFLEDYTLHGWNTDTWGEFTRRHTFSTERMS